ncbi:prenyltransferase/squalene oxidase repeat-containing protein [Amycolatopsis magusensis]|uniref:prenyltransferase/squalene oxidase repeat-containing protein n=1 Tax=Amycolatopsis magusensis TaxID=882444 RepID=UPI003789BAAA
MTSLRADEISEAIAGGAEALFSAQRPDGVFDYGEHALTSTLGTVGAVSALHFADPAGSADLIARGAAWLERTQADDGGWSMVPGQASEAGPTAVATATLHLLGDHESSVHKGQTWLEGFGGLAAIPHAEVVAWCRQYYGFAGWLDPREMRRFPLELALFPGLYRKLFDLRAPMVSALGLAQTRHKPLSRVHRKLSKLAEPKALDVIRQVYEHEGSTGGWCEDAWVTGLIVAGLARADLGHDMVARAVGWFRETVNEDGSWNSGPLDLTWSMYAAAGLLEAGYREDARLGMTKELFLRLQQDQPFVAFGCPPGFWGWSGTKGWPATLETGEIVSALCHLPGEDQAESVQRGVTWLTLQQDTRGSWGLCVRNTKVANSGPCPHMTAQALDGLLDSGVPVDDRRVRRGLRWLASAQLPDGSFESVWYRMHTAGTSAVLQTFAKAGLSGEPAAVRARDWLERTQHENGSWGTGAPADAGTVEETAWAVSALLAAGAPAESVLPGVRWLLAERERDGGWPAARVNEYVRHVSRYANPALANGLALRALARYRKAVR